MSQMKPARGYRFGAFEVDRTTGELRRQGIRIKLGAQPLQVLLMLLERPGELLTREEISRELWPDGTFVDYEHGVNSAVNRIREALRDTARSPKFVETLSRRGYRFVAAVERVGEIAAETAVGVEAEETERVGGGFLATEAELPKTSHGVVRLLFVGLQVMYVGFYVGALANLAEIEDLFSVLPWATLVLRVMVVSAAVLIPVRAFTVSAVLMRAPGAREKLLRIWPYLLVVDLLWALAPFLLLHHMSFGLAVACTTLLVYSPFAQRALVLMGAGGER